jgi:hypothetical protein
MHLLYNTIQFGDPMQYESGKGERGLKEWAKAVALTAQKTSLNTFLKQTISRVADRLLMSRASDIVKRQKTATARTTTPEIVTNRESVTTRRKHPHFKFYRQGKMLKAVDRFGMERDPTKEKSGLISMNVLSLFDKEELEQDVIEIWCEVTLPRTRDSVEPQVLRAHPKLDNFGAYYDWVDARFDMLDDDASTSSDHETDVAPAKLLAFYVVNLSMAYLEYHPL